MREEPIIIRKYENRRLYDTSTSRYVNLDEVAEMVRRGVEVKVVDARSGEDLTRVILTQIIVEDAKGHDSALPLEFLRQLIMASGRATQEGFVEYTRSVFGTYQRAYDIFQRHLREAAPVAAAPLDFLHAVLNPGAPAHRERPADETQGAANDSEGGPEDQHARELEQLRRRIEGLERKLSRSAESKSSRRRRLP